MDVLAIIVVVGALVTIVSMVSGGSAKEVSRPQPLSDVEKQFKVLIDTLDAVEKVDQKSLVIANDLLAKAGTPLKEKANIASFVEHLEVSLATIEKNRQSLRTAVPEDHVLIRFADFDGVRDYLQAQWVKAISNQKFLLELTVDCHDALTPQDRLTETAKIRLDSIIAGIDTLKRAQIFAGDVTAYRARETIGAFMVDAVAANGPLCDREVAFLNRVLEQALTAEQYMVRYSSKLNEDRASKDLVALISEVSKFSAPVVELLLNEMDPLVLSAVAADGIDDEKGFNKLSTFKDLVREHFGSEEASLGRPEHTAETEQPEFEPKPEPKTERA